MLYGKYALATTIDRWAIEALIGDCGFTVPITGDADKGAGGANEGTGGEDEGTGGADGADEGAGGADEAAGGADEGTGGADVGGSGVGTYTFSGLVWCEV